MSDELKEPLASADEKIATLERELAILRKEKELVEAKLELVSAENILAERKLDLMTSQVAAEKQNYETNLSVTTLKMDWLAAAKELEYLKNLMDVNGIPASEAREVLCIEFSNKLRHGAFKEIEKDADDILVLKATAYETFYKACIATLEDRNLRFKLQARDRFAESVVTNRKKKSEKETVKVERARAADPREKMIESMMNLSKCTREAAIEEIEKMNAKARQLTAK